VSEDREAPQPPSPVESAQRTPLYPPWAGPALRLALSLIVLTGVGVPVLFMSWARSSYATLASTPLVQPVLFDHRHHVRDEGIDCRYCHAAVEHSNRAGVPSVRLCMNCHAQIWNDAPQLSMLRSSEFTGTVVRWQQVTTLPGFVYFNHSAHVRRNVGCVTCHGRVDRMAAVYMPEAMTMSWCLDCHRRPAARLRPSTAITDPGWEPDRPALEIGKEIAEREHISPPTNCTGCHR
jgi:hypothetical protein